MTAKKTKEIPKKPETWKSIARFRGIDFDNGKFIEAPMFADHLVELQQSNRGAIRTVIVGD